MPKTHSDFQFPFLADLTMKTSRSGGSEENRTAAPETEKTVSDCSILALPPSLLVEIFVRLPLFDLMNCKLVCSAWHKLLTEYSFAYIYERNSSYTHLLSPDDVVRGDSTHHFVFLLEISENGDFIQRRVKVELPVWLKSMPVAFIIGSCYGVPSFICYKYSGLKVIYLTNPLMGECIELPERQRYFDDKVIAHHKIGFSPSLNKIKVLRIAYRDGHDSEAEECEIFTVGVDSRWRGLSCLFTPMCFLHEWISLDGVLHWISEDNSSAQISTFGLGDEKFGQISHPPGLLLKWETMRLWLINHELNLIDYSIQSQITIWTMRKYADAKSWTKDVILRSWFPKYVKSHRLVPVEKSKNGDILFGHTYDLVSFNLKQKKCSKRLKSGLNRRVPHEPPNVFLKEAKMKGQWSHSFP